jgi:hypothetical protein
MRERIEVLKIALKKLGLVLIGAVIGVSYLIAYTNYIESLNFIK